MVNLKGSKAQIHKLFKSPLEAKMYEVLQEMRTTRYQAFHQI